MEKVHSRDKTPIAFERRGQGPPLILVGGAFNHRNSRVAGLPLAELLAPHFTVMAYDRRGRGDSGDRQPYAVEREVEDLEALIAEAGGSAIVYGHSSGAVLALEAAAHGLPISKLALYEPPLALEENEVQRRVVLTHEIADLVSSNRRGGAVEAFLTKAVGVPENAVAQMRQAPFWPGLESIAHTLVYDLTITRDFRLSGDRTASIAVPALVIDGEMSPPALRSAAMAVADALSGAQYRTLNGQTHDVDIEVLAPVLNEWFR